MSHSPSSPDTPSSPAPSSRRADPADLVDLKHVLLVLRERWIGSLGLALFVSCLAGFVMLRKPPTYAATAALLVELTTDRVVDIKKVVDETVESNSLEATMLTHIEQLRAHTFLLRVINSMTEAEKANVLAAYGESQETVPTQAGVVPDLDPPTARLIAYLDKGLSAERSGRTLLINITVKHRQAELAQWLANRVADQYIRYLIERSDSSNNFALSFLEEQAAKLSARVAAAELELQKYRERENLVSLEDNQNIVVERLKALSSAVTDARVARLALDARVNQAEAILKNPAEARQLASLPEFTGFADVQKQIDTAEAQREVLQKRYGRQHPLMIENASSLDLLKTLRQTQIDAALNDLRNQRAKALTQETQLAAELSSAEKESLRLDQLTVAYNVLKRASETTRETYTQILARLNETTISSKLQNTNIKIADRAARPGAPFEPNRRKVFLVVSVLGLVIFVGFPLAADMLDGRIRSWTDIEGYLGHPLLGELCVADQVPVAERNTIVSREVDDPLVESFRSLYSQLRLSRKTTAARSFLITSTLPGEGKSFVASNLAASFAAHGRRTLLVDGDLRRPTLHEPFGVKNDRGLLRWLKETGGAEISATHPSLGITEVSPNFFLLTSGGQTRKLTELIDTGRFASLIDHLHSHYDVIIVDSPPSGVFPDAESLSRFVEELIFVTRFKHTNRQLARQVLDRMAKTGLVVAGVVFNAIPSGELGYSYSSGYGAVKSMRKYYTRDSKS